MLLAAQVHDGQNKRPNSPHRTPKDTIRVQSTGIVSNQKRMKLEDSGDESEGCGRIKGTRREGSNATLLCHERKVLLAESTKHLK